jgi:hypothetical protein
MKIQILSNFLLSGVLAVSAAQADIVDNLLTAYKGQGAGPFDTAAGAAL